MHVCTEECTKIHPIELDWNDNGDLYIRQKKNLIGEELPSDYDEVIVEEDEILKLLDQLHKYWEHRLWIRLENFLEEHKPDCLCDEHSVEELMLITKESSLV